MNKTKKKKNNNKRNKNYALKLYRGVDFTYGKSAIKLIKYRDTILINQGQSDFKLLYGGDRYLNVFYRLSTSLDFSQMVSPSNIYLLCKPLEFQVNLYRIANDTQLANMGMSDPTLHVSWFPTKLGFTNNNDALNQENALVVPSLSLEKHSRTYPVRSMQIPITDGTVYVLNPAIPVEINNFYRLPGCLTMGTYNTTNSAATVQLYTIEIVCRVQFYCPT